MKALILTSDLRSKDDRSFCRLMGILENDSFFVLYLTDVHPYFFCLQEYSDSLPKAPEESPFYSLNRKKLSKIRFKDIESLRNLERSIPREALFESDIDHHFRLLQDHFPRGCIEISGEPKEKKGNTWIYFNNKIKKTTFTPELKSFSFDLETSVETHDFTDPRNHLYSISVHSNDHQLVLMLSNENRIQKKEDFDIHYLDSERSLIETFIKIVQKDRSSVFIGWNVINFDFQFLIRKAQALDIPFSIGVDNMELEYRYSKNRDIYITIPGKIILDGMQVVRLQQIALPNYKLDTAASVILGKNKVIQLTNDAKVQQIKDYFEKDKEALALYNYMDSKLVSELFMKIDSLSFILYYRKLSSVSFEHLFSFIDLFDYQYLPQLHAHQCVANNKSYQKNLFASKQEPSTLILEGLYGKTFLIKAHQLHAHIIMNFYLDLFGKLKGEKNPDESILINQDTYFHPQFSLFPKTLKNLFESKEQAKGQKTLTKAIDIYIENLTKGFLNPYSRFFSPHLLHLFQEKKKWVLELSSSFLKKASPNVKLIFQKEGDFILEAQKEEEVFSILNNLNDYISKTFQENIQITSTIQWSINQSLDQTLITSSGYAFIQKEEIKEFLNNKKYSIHLLGLFQSELLYCIFHRNDTQLFLKEFEQKLKNGNYDQSLVYKKKINPSKKNLSSLHKPPHLVAAEKQGGNLTWIEYSMTINGPEPISLLKSPFHYDYYMKTYIHSTYQNILSSMGYKDTIKENEENQQLDFL